MTMDRRWALALIIFAGCKGEDKNPVANELTRISQVSSGTDTAGRPGDWLFGERIVIQDAGSSTGWGSYGGSIVDVAGQSDADPLTEIFFQCELRAFAPESATPGEDGTLHMSGADRGIPFLDALLPTSALGVEMALDAKYATKRLDLALTVQDKIGSTRPIGCGAVFIRGDNTRFYSDDDWVGAMGDTIKPAYVFKRLSGSMELIAPQADVAVLQGDKLNLRGGGKVTDQYVLTIGDDLEEALAPLRDPTVPRRIVRLVPKKAEILGDRISEVIYEIFDPTGTIISATHTQAALTAGNYVVHAIFEGREVGVSNITVRADSLEAVDAEVTLTSLSALRVRTSIDGQAGPARVRITNVRETYLSGDATVILPPGSYVVLGSHGPEHETATSSVTLADGQTVDVELRIDRAFETPGWISGDFHVHSTRSVDAQTSRELRRLGAAAEGLDLVAATDHDTIGVLGPDANGVRFVSGMEMSMFYGHMNGYPMTLEEPASYFKPGWFLYSSTGVFERLLEPVEVSAALRDHGAEIVQINHPRADQGVFNYINFDPETAESERTWPNPDTFEIINGKRLGDTPEVLADFLGLLTHGKKITGTGTSDVHDDLGIGYARTLIQVADTSDLTAVWKALREGRAVATTGPFLTITATAAGGLSAKIGDTLATNGAVTIRIETKTPSWMPLSRVRLYENKREVLVRDATPGMFSTTYTSSSAGDLFFLAVVEGGEAIPTGKASLAVTNPIYVDRN
jgi:hypothetical protein